MVKKLSVQSKSIRCYQTAAEEQYTEQKIVAKMLSEGKRCVEIDRKANHKKKERMANFQKNNPSFSDHKTNPAGFVRWLSVLV